MSPTSEPTEIFAVYRIEGEVAILVGEELDEVAVPLSDLPDPLSEETVLRVQRHGDGTPAWRTARIDDESEDRRRAEQSEVLLARIRAWEEEQREEKRKEAAAGEDRETEEETTP